MRARLGRAELLKQVLCKVVGDFALQALCLIVGFLPWIIEKPDQEMLQEVVAAEDLHGQEPALLCQLDALVSRLPRQPKALQPAQGLGNRGAADSGPGSETRVAHLAIVPGKDVDPAYVLRGGGETLVHLGCIDFHYINILRAGGPAGLLMGSRKQKVVAGEVLVLIQNYAVHDGDLPDVGRVP